MYEGQAFSSLDEALAHYGVKGMKWGVRKESLPGVSARTSREARKDAKEFARAKMFYGEGAGTRRKLINKSVEAKAKRDPNYKKAFDHHLENQDLSSHASKARSERRRKDTKAKVGRGVRGTRHILNGNSQYASAVTALLVGGALAAHRAGIDKVILDAATTKYADVKRQQSRRAAPKSPPPRAAPRPAPKPGGTNVGDIFGRGNAYNPGDRARGTGLNQGRNESPEDFLRRMGFGDI